MEGNKDIIELARVFGKTLKKYGIKHVISQLASIGSEDRKNKGNRDIINLIIKQVCIEYGIQEYEIKKSYIKDDVYNARMVSIVLIKKHTRLTHEEIADIFEITHKSKHSRISSSLTLFKKLNDSIKYEKKALDTFSVVDKIIQNHIQLSK